MQNDTKLTAAYTMPFHAILAFRISYNEVYVCILIIDDFHLDYNKENV